MKVTREKEEDRQVFLRIELEPPEVDKALEQAYRRLVKKANIPGFRQGKAPREVLERYIGKDGLLEDAIDNLLPEVYGQALKEEKIEAIADPQIEVVQREPVVFTAVVPLKPAVELGKYRGIKLKPEKAEVTREEVDTVIEQLRLQNGTWEPAERPVAFEDLVVMDVESLVEDKPFINQQGAQYQVKQNQPLPTPDFADQLIGMKVGEEKEFKLQLPQDYSQTELAGKEAGFKVKINEVKQQHLPRLDKEFAKLVSPDLKTMAALKKRLISNLTIQAEQKAREAFEEKVIDAVVDLSKVEFPPVLADSELERLMEQQARWMQESGLGLEEYLGRINKTEEELREELRPVAAKRVTRSLVLGKVAEAEKIEVTDEEITADLEKLVQGSENKVEMKERISLPQVRGSMEQMLATQKTVQRLAEIAGGSVDARKK
ncbi:MAG: trigger factor [Dehalococcoidia bacterium]|nr:trigger factor [Dehalococcoidia bacterium]